MNAGKGAEYRPIKNKNEFVNNFNSIFGIKDSTKKDIATLDDSTNKNREDTK